MVFYTRQMNPDRLEMDDNRAGKALTTLSEAFGFDLFEAILFTQTISCALLLVIAFLLLSRRGADPKTTIRKPPTELPDKPRTNQDRIQEIDEILRKKKPTGFE